jgi:hypothetical protein
MSSESFGGTINLHMIAKSGSWVDLVGKPTLKTLQLQVNGVNISGGDIRVYATDTQTMNIPVPKIEYVATTQQWNSMTKDPNTLYLLPV